MRHLELLDLAPLDAPALPPDFVVDEILERGAVTVLSGDTGTSKSLLALSMCVAVHRGEAWLGWATKPGPILLSDAEMTQRLAYERLRAFGLHGPDAGSFGYLNREAVDLGDEESVEALRALCAQRQASVLTLDALMGHAPTVEVNDNSAAVKLYTEVLRPLAAELDLAVLLVHHEAKPKPGPRDSSLATMGARQWVGQADCQLTLERAPKPNSTITVEADGSRRTVYRIRLRTPKRRDAPDSQRFEPLRVVSRHHPSGLLDWIKIEADDAVPSPPDRGRDRDQAHAEQLGAFVKGRGSASTAAMAEELGLDPEHGTFRRARDLAVDLGLFKRIDKGLYGC